MQERRENERLLCAELVQLVWEDPGGCERRKIANLEDISLCGLCLQLETVLGVGTRLRVLYGDGELVGIVRYATHRDGAYFLGVQLDDSSRWSTRHFRPQHLLDPSELVARVLARRIDEDNITDEMRSVKNP